MKFARFLPIIVCVILVINLVVLAGCEEDAWLTTNQAEIGTIHNENVQLLDTSVIIENDRLVFAFSLSEFIDTYNALYFAENDKEYLRAEEDWLDFSYEDSPFSKEKSVYHRFNYDETVLTHPTISVYTSADSEKVQGITVDFDDHGYTPYQYAIYENQCLYSLKSLLPDCSDDKLIMLYTELNNHAYNKMKTVKMTADTVPDLLYYGSSVGVFSYFTFGDYVHLCIVPADDEYLSKVIENGGEVRCIDSLS